MYILAHVTFYNYQKDTGFSKATGNNVMANIAVIAYLLIIILSICWLSTVKNT